MFQRSHSSGTDRDNSTAAIEGSVETLRRIRCDGVVLAMQAMVLDQFHTDRLKGGQPHMQGNLGATLAEIGWVITGYSLTFAHGSRLLLYVDSRRGSDDGRRCGSPNY